MDYILWCPTHKHHTLVRADEIIAGDQFSWFVCKCGSGHQLPPPDISYDTSSVPQHQTDSEHDRKTSIT